MKTKTPRPARVEVTLSEEEAGMLASILEYKGLNQSTYVRQSIRRDHEFYSTVLKMKAKAGSR